MKNQVAKTQKLVSGEAEPAKMKAKKRKRVSQVELALKCIEVSDYGFYTWEIANRLGISTARVRNVCKELVRLQWLVQRGRKYHAF